MTANPPSPVPMELAALLARQKQACLDDPLPTAAVRIDRLRRLEAVIIGHQKAWCAAMDEDFAGRPPVQTRMEMVGTLSSIRDASKNLRRWMKPSRRPLPLLMRAIGARAEVFYQPLGVIGVIAPWNFPLVLALGALGGVFAAGNRALLKPSELTPRTSALMKELLDATFDPTELATVLGGPDVGESFTRLPFDHLLFTGAPSVARQVMRTAAENLVPVTLELGGKCPVIVGPEADWGLAVDRIIWGKIQNAGQICLAPDYVFVPRGREEAFIAAARHRMATWYPRIKDNPDFCSIINERHYARLMRYVEEARARGLRLEVLDAAAEDFSAQAGRRIPPTIFVEPSDDFAIMQDEVFGPLLSLKSYDDFEAVIDFINARPRPLALYYFGSDRRRIRRLKEGTTSGGITINDIAGHASTETLPLGGVGNSGMGRYHGYDGFLNFSHHKAVLKQGRISLGRMFNPPYGAGKSKMLDRVIGRPMR